MNKTDLPALPDKFIYKLDLRGHVTPRLLKTKPIHRWFWFPHSFSPQLLDEVLKVYPLPAGARILDPFVGAGTTVLRANQLGYSATGCDLSPLSIFVSRTKLQTYLPERIEAALKKLRLMPDMPFQSDVVLSKHLEEWESTERLQRAFTFKEWKILSTIYEWIQSYFLSLPYEYPERDLFLLAWLNVQQQISRAVPDGGWFRWVDKADQSHQIMNLFIEQIKGFLADVSILPFNRMSDHAKAEKGLDFNLYQIDSRDLSSLPQTYDLILTSPPYPNRHDYSRIFHLALLGLGLSETEIFTLRHRSIRSHVEAIPPEKNNLKFTPPLLLQKYLDLLPSNSDPRIAPMLLGYFEDMALFFYSLWSVLKNRALCVVVVGNVRHGGILIPVDEILIKIAENFDFIFEEAWVARLRGNSAQQMAKYGKIPSRETILIFKKI